MNIFLILTLAIVVLILIWALFGGSEDPVIENKRKKDQDNEELPEKTFRRRTVDKEIENEEPITEKTGENREKRRGEDIESSDSEGGIKNEEFKKRKFKLPFSVEEIIPKNSRAKIYKRTLENSEIYAAKEDFDTAISLYEGVNARIQNIDIKEKINRNIEYLKNYKKYNENKEEKKKKGRRASDKKETGNPNEIKFNIDGQIPQTVNISVVDPLKEIEANNIAEKISAELKSVKNDLSKLKETTQNKLPIPPENLLNEISALKNKIDELEEEQKNRNISIPEDGSAEILGLKENLEEQKNYIEKLIDENQQRSAELDQLNQKISSIPIIPESNVPPITLQAKDEISQNKMNRDNSMMELLEKIPEAIDSVSKLEERIDDKLQKIGDQTKDTKEKKELPDELSSDTPIIEKEKQKEIEKTNEDQEEDLNEFDLLKDYGKEKEEDISDEEIFEKILKDERPPKPADNFEILGEKKQDENPFGDITSKEMNDKLSEEEQFYKKFLKADRMKKKELPILKVSFDFKKLPDELSLSKEKNIIEYSFYKYKPMLEKAEQFIKERKVRDAINYYKVVLNQNIPPEFKGLIRRNIRDLTEYLEKYLSMD